MKCAGDNSIVLPYSRAPPFARRAFLHRCFTTVSGLFPAFFVSGVFKGDARQPFELMDQKEQARGEGNARRAVRSVPTGIPAEFEPPHRGARRVLPATYPPSFAPAEFEPDPQGDQDGSLG